MTACEKRNCHFDRRCFLKITSAGTVACFFSGFKLPGNGKRPNILFIAVDDLRPELNCYGVDYVKSPNIDAIAKRGVLFLQAHCQSAVCNPSRASLMTGLRPDSTRVWDLQTNFRTTIPGVVTLPQHFRDNGYYAAAIGKIYHNIFPDDQSWSEPEMHIDGYPFDPDAVYRSRENMDLIEQRKKEITAGGDQARYIDKYGKWYLKAKAFEIVDMPDNVYYDGAQTDVAVEKLGELSRMGKPFFFGIGYYRPHLPFNVPKKYWDMYDREKIPLAENDYLPRNSPPMAINNMKELAGYSDFKNTRHPAEGKLSEEEARLLKHGYLASVSYVDAQIGRLVERLKQLNLHDNTIIVLWGDNGWKLGEHNSWCKMTDYEVDTRVPLIVSAPGIGKSNIKCEGMVELVDIYPGLCELAGLKIPDGLEGTSFVPLLSNPERKWKQAVFSQYLSEGKWAPPDGISYMSYSIRTAGYRYVEFYKWPAKEYADCELYDHKIDPGENNNIAALSRNKELVAKLSAQLKKGWKAVLP